ncbi:MAG: DNA polymerase III subunit beta [Phycisphaerae bacterium]
MKVICNRSRLAEALGLVSSVAVARSPRPILQCLRMQAEDGANSKLTLFATDLELGLRCELKEVEVTEPGQTVASAAKLNAIVHEVTDETITLSTEQDSLEVMAAGSKFKLFTFDPNEFPPVAPKEEGKVFTVTAGELTRVSALTGYAAAKETTRYAINGLLVEVNGNKMIMVGTDGRRLAKASANLPSKVAEPISTIIPSRAVAMLSRLATEVEAPVTIRVTESQVAFEVSGVLMISSVIEGRYPSYDAVIPKESTCKVKIDRLTLLSGLRRASLLVSRDTRGVKVQLSKDRMTIEAHSPEEGEAAVELPIELEGEPIQIAFNPDYLVDPLKILTQEQVVMEFRAPNTPAVLKAGPDFLYVLMPVTL